MHKVLLFAKLKLINFSEGETCSYEKKKENYWEENIV